MKIMLSSFRSVVLGIISYYTEGILSSLDEIRVSSRSLCLHISLFRIVGLIWK